jgi:riboflavin kinase/FMN adenylyltransferase
MQTLHSLPALTAVPGPVHLAIGFFDGVHAGHQEVIGHARRSAAEDGGTAVVVTFDPHPLKVLRPESAPRLLTSTRHKAKIMERLGAGHLLVIPFSRELAAQEPAAFIAELAAACRPLASITVGKSWAFGKARAGNLATLTALGHSLQFSAHGIAPVSVGGEVVSSTRIRTAVECGDFETAATLLAREYSVLGTVKLGRQLGRRLEFPTANLTLESEQLPPIGVYAVRAMLDGRVLPGVANLGHRPTVEGTSERHLEVHLFDFAADIYGHDMEVRFAQRLREEVRFESLDELKAQIARDAQRARQVLGA